MDNIIYIILAAAVFIAMAGILLFIAGDSLVDADEEASDLEDVNQYIPEYTSGNLNSEKTEEIIQDNKLDNSKVVVHG